MKRTSNQSGFSLIELMVVVAIIGILASIAVPNFTRFQNRARKSEAQGQLSTLYTAMTAFRVEWNRFYGDFRDIGYAPDGQLRYAVGFSASGVAPGLPFVGSTVGPAAGACFNNKQAAGCLAVGANAAAAPAWAASAAGPAGCRAGSDPEVVAGQFTASARGTIAGGNDDWTVNEAKLICNNVPQI